MDNNMRLSYSPVNQCYLLTWHDQIIEMYEDREDAKIDLRYKGLQLNDDNTVSKKGN